MKRLLPNGDAPQPNRAFALTEHAVADQPQTSYWRVRFCSASEKFGQKCIALRDIGTIGLARTIAGLALILSTVAVPAHSASLIPALTADQAAQAAKILEGFQTNPRGPFYRIQWYCNDGTVHPPSPPPCKERGGGYQHASLSPEALKLAQWNIDVGTILAGQDFDRLFDADRDHHRLKEIVLENYLEAVENGWIYRRAYSYRGARQAEDEDKAGRQFLITLLSKPDWTSRNYYLVTQLVESMPHGARSRTVRRIRTLAESVADQDSRFQSLRAKIHSAPGPEDLAAVEAFRAGKNVSEPVSKLLIELADLLKQQQSDRALEGQLTPAAELFKDTRGALILARLQAALDKKDNPELFAAAAELSATIHDEITHSADGRRNLALLDLNSSLQEFAFETARKLPPVARRQTLQRLIHYFQLATGTGLLSERQFDALQSTIDSFVAKDSVDAQEYFRTARYLNRSTEWCRATAAKFFGPVSRHYEPVEPKAGALLDHLLRGSIALPLADALLVVSSDANKAAGIANSIFGSEASQAVMGLNPGGAIGRLEILKPGDDAGGDIDPRAIYVIPETVSDLKPMKGVLSLDSGNSLSHTQLLAANLGIPNATVPSSMLPVLEPHRGKEVVFAVTPKGAVILRETASLTKAEREVWAKETSVSGPRQSLDISRLDLSSRQIIDLHDLSVADSGVRVGPKAANLAQLMKFFPERVAGGVVIPFGIFAEHIRRRIGSDSKTLEEQINDAFTEAERLRENGEPPSTVTAYIYPRLAEFRRKIQTMPLLPKFEATLRERLRREFVSGETFHGVFVRSDTNAEDLPQFTGAGLNLTVPNVVGIEGVEQALKDVWASPFTERAYDWRSRILIDSQSVYPSVIIMRAVPVEKSGVIATVNLDTGATDEITVNVSEGVSAVVDGGVAESLLLRADGSVQLLQQARAPYRRVCLPSGGFGLLPAVGNDYLLSPAEIGEIRNLVAEVKSKYPPATTESGEPLPWDIEFGFEKGRLMLLQIRPLVRFSAIQTLNSLANLDSAEGIGKVRLDEKPL